MSYLADPSSRELPLTIQDVENVIQSRGKGLLKNSRGLDHFLNRVMVTFRAYREQINLLHRQYQQMQLSNEHAGAPTTLHPIDSFRYLSPAEQKQVMDSLLAQKFDSLQAELANVRQTRGELDRLVNALTFQLGGLLDDASVSPRIRDQVRTLLSASRTAPTPDPAPAIEQDDPDDLNSLFS
jgi:hypothetical protein